MLSKTKIKWIKSLERKKNRDEYNLFVAEGKKIVSDLLPWMKCRFLAYIPNTAAGASQYAADEIVEITESEYKKITFQKSPQGVLAVFEKPKYSVPAENILNNLNLALDGVQDPGNLGTIIRTADWFGIQDVFCSLHSADVFSPKTIQATMGAIARVRVHYVDLARFLENIKGKTPIYGTFMDGTVIYDEALTENGIIVMGNEGGGISEDILPLITKKLMIPNFPPESITSESLNVAAATAITVSEFRRKKFNM